MKSCRGVIAVEPVSGQVAEYVGSILTLNKAIYLTHAVIISIDEILNQYFKTLPALIWHFHSFQCTNVLEYNGVLNAGLAVK